MMLTLKGRLNITKCFLYSQVNYLGLLADLKPDELEQVEELIMHYMSEEQRISSKKAFAPVSQGGLRLTKLSDTLNAQQA